MFANRLRKNLKSAQDWARRESVDCYRIYDADMPEYAFAIDQYGDGEGNRWVVVQEYAPPKTIEPKRRASGATKCWLSFRRAGHSRRIGCSFASAASRRTARNTRS